MRTSDPPGKPTVIIPAYGPAPHLEKVVDALLRQQPPVGRVIISHSAAGDPTGRFEENRHVTVLHSPGRLYAGAARNRGLSLAKEEWVAFIDEDVIVSDGWHAALQKAVERNDADCIVGSIGYAQSGGYWGMVVWYVEFGSVHPYLARRAAFAGASANMVIRSTMLNAIGGFPEDLHRGEDTVAQIRLKNIGARIVFDPKVVGNHVNLPGMGRMLRHLYLTGQFSARIRDEFSRIPGGLAARWPILSLGLWLARLLQTVRRVVSAPHAPVLLLLMHLPGILLGLLAWNAGFSIEAFSAWLNRYLRPGRPTRIRNS